MARNFSEGNILVLHPRKKVNLQDNSETFKQQNYKVINKLLLLHTKSNIRKVYRRYSSVCKY